MTTPPPGPVRLEADGLVLRAYGPADVPDLDAAFADVEIARWSPAPAGPDPAEAFIRSRNDWSEGDHASWAIADAADRLVGSVSVHRMDRVQGDAQIGYWVAPWARRQGYAVRAVRLATRFAVSELGMHRLALYHAVANPGSCAVATAAGFRLEGTMRESYLYADGVHHDEHVHGLLARDVLPG
ncbi:GNAT family N-acetyltransferase [Ornithinimicrobium sufpigmenti]|uniref:GNAT family N-acetyltransferase n=1 Tax=Ornithinimicrobium sufpigmenti TaxID=2508882 RepID=UPI0010362F94|nr:MULTISPECIES: GNAT family protein [unclassified Ornithinimicrobium]